MTVKSLDELLEVPLRVMRPRRGLRMVLNGENRVLPVTYSFNRPIIEVEMCDLK